MQFAYYTQNHHSLNQTYLYYVPLQVVVKENMIIK
jgi:hypothetical protein